MRTRTHARTQAGRQTDRQTGERAGRQADADTLPHVVYIVLILFIYRLYFAKVGPLDPAHPILVCKLGNAFEVRGIDLIVH